MASGAFFISLAGFLQFLLFLRHNELLLLTTFFALIITRLHGFFKQLEKIGFFVSPPCL
jgi:hypothetical protein